MNGEGTISQVVVAVEGPRETRYWTVRLDKYLRPFSVEALIDDVVPEFVTTYVVSHRMPVASEVLAIVRRDFMYSHRRSA